MPNGDNQESTATVDNSDLSVTTEAEGFTAPTDTQKASKDQAASWVSSLDPEFKDHPSLKNFKTPNDLAKSWVNAQKLIGGNKIVLPGKNAKPEEIAEFYNKLGRPDKVDGYKFDPLPEPIQHESRENNFAEMAHKIGLSNAQANNIRKWWAEEMNAELSRQDEGFEESKKETETILRREWGMAYQTKMGVANKVVSMFSPETQQKLLKALGNDADIIRDLAKLGAQFSEDGMIGRPGNDLLSPEEAQAKIAELKMHPGYLDGQHPEHKLIVQKMTNLFKMLHPDQ